MRLYTIRKRPNLKRIVVCFGIFILLSAVMRMGGFFRRQHKESYPQMTIKKYEVFRFEPEKFTVGSFLKKRVPGNMSYCHFRLGDSESFNYTDADISYSPELGYKGFYRVIYGVVKGYSFNSSETYTVTYATHLTLPYLFHVVEIASRWGGPVSVACFLPGTDTFLALKILEKMCFCLKEMENVHIHFIYHKDHPPKEMSFKNYSLWLDMEDVVETPWKMQNSSFGVTSTTPANKFIGSSCYVPEKILKMSYKSKHRLAYPINVARNVARYGTKSKFILVSDIELLPSDNLVSEFLKMAKRFKEKSKSLGDHYFTKKKHVYVLPVFEVSEDQPDVPHTKAELLDLYEKEKAVYFHRYVCVHCQRFPGIQRWIQRRVNPWSKIGIIQPFLVVKREFPYHRWEPIYIGTNTEPLFSELLTWEGQQDKMSQMHEMCLLEYRFVILNGAFLVHTPGIKRKAGKGGSSILNKSGQKGSNTSINLNSITTISNSEVEWRNSHIKRNARLYQIITKDVMRRYRYNARCRIH